MADGTDTALVTGASSGIGRELARLFARDGYDLVLVARREDRLTELGETLSDRHGVAAVPLPTDLSTPDAGRELYAEVTDRGITVDALVNNAGFGVYGRFTGTDLDEELDVIHLHVVTVTVLAKLFGREMADRGHGYVLNTASIAGFAPVPTSAVYSAAKHYQRAFSEALAEELAGTGVTVTALCPGPTDTGFMEVGGFDAAGYGPDDMMDAATVAEAGYEGLLNGERIVVPGLLNRARVFLGRVLPRRWYVRAAERTQN